MSLQEILEYNFINIGGYSLNLLKLLLSLAIFFGARFFIWTLVRLMVKPILKRQKKLDVGRAYAFQTFLRYFIYFIAVLLMLQTLGVQLSVLWAGSAALLVGLGFGLQQTFNDFISGLILLFEGSVEVGDVIVVDGIVGRIREIGLRTTELDSRDDVSHIIPNSKIVSNTTINWSHNEIPTRFQIKIGVAYGSDVQLVTKLLLQAASEHPKVLDEPESKVMFKDFGNSSLDFELHLFSFAYMEIEFVRSDLRYRINALFQQNNIEIPFPQQDVWLRSKDSDQS